MESLNKKAPLNFAAAAGKTASTQPTATTTSAGPTSGSGQPPAKNGTNVTNPSSLGPQSSAPSPTAGADKAAAASASSGSIDWIVGLNVKVVTQADEVFEGQVYAYDVIMNCIVLHINIVVNSLSKTTSSASTPAAYYSPSLGTNSSAPRPKYDFRILKISYIKDVTPLPTTKANNDKDAAEDEKNNITPNVNNSNNTNSNVYSTALPAIGYVQLDKIQQREQQAVREAHAAAARIGVGVSTIAQDIFDALSKTWSKDSIVVMDEVIISAPYEPENCKTKSSSSYALDRVKKVLEGERMRLANGRR